MTDAHPSAAACSVRCSVRRSPENHEAPELAGLWPQAAPGSQLIAGLLAVADAPESARRNKAASAPSEGRAEPAAPSHRPATQDQIARLSRRLTDRDHLILASLRLHHYLTTQQLQQFHFDGHETGHSAARICRRTLARLRGLGVIEHLQRRVGGTRAGSAAHIWRIGLRGDRLLRLAAPGQPRARRKEPSLRFLDHCLAVADAHLALQLTAASLGGELIRVQGEPDCWRSFVRPSGASDILKPDLYAVTASGEFEDHWFIEVDRATESLPTIVKKCRQYRDYRHSGSEQTRRGIFPKVIWLVPDSDRADKLQRAVEATPELAAMHFVFGTLIDLPRVIRAGAE